MKKVFLLLLTTTLTAQALPASAYPRYYGNPRPVRIPSGVNRGIAEPLADIVQEAHDDLVWQYRFDIACPALARGHKTQAIAQAIMNQYVLDHSVEASDISNNTEKFKEAEKFQSQIINLLPERMYAECPGLIPAQ